MKNIHCMSFGKHIRNCSYGENPWQQDANLFAINNDDPLAVHKFEILNDGQLSYTSYIDLDRLLQTATHIVQVLSKNNFNICDKKIAVAVKHGNPCGACVGDDDLDVIKRMLAGNKRAVFGGAILTSFEIDEKCARILVSKYPRTIISPSFSASSLRILTRGGRGVCVVNPYLCVSNLKLDELNRFKSVRGGYITQQNYTFVPDFYTDKISKSMRVNKRIEEDMMFAWAVGSTSNSNTITLVKDKMLIGNGVGQQDRVGAAQLAVSIATQSGHDTKSSVAYSDSFFPFPDGPMELINAGVSAIFTTSGSIRDKEIVSLCDRERVALYMIKDSVGRGFFGH